MPRVEVNRRKENHDDFYTSYMKGSEVAARSAQLQIMQQKAHLDFVQEILNQKLESQKLQVEMAKAGVSPPRAPEVKQGMFNPFTGNPTEGGMFIDPGSQGWTKAPERAKPKDIDAFDLMILSDMMQNPDQAGYARSYLKERGVDPSQLDRSMQRQPRPSAEAPTTEYGRAMFGALMKIPASTPPEVVFQHIAVDNKLTQAEKVLLLRTARERFKRQEN